MNCLLTMGILEQFYERMPEGLGFFLLSMLSIFPFRIDSYYNANR